MIQGRQFESVLASIEAAVVDRLVSIDLVSLILFFDRLSVVP